MKALFLMCLMLMMTACAAIDLQQSSARVPVQFAVMNAIEQSDNVTARGVLERTAYFRQILESDDSIDVSILLAEAIVRTGMDKMPPSDRMLLQIVFYNIEQSVADVRTGVPPDQLRVRLLTLLDWIDYAARLYL